MVAVRVLDSGLGAPVDPPHPDQFTLNLQMRLPNGTNAVLDDEKLASYCLNSSHPTGKNKARVFANALGLTAANADLLRVALLDAAESGEATPGDADVFGERYTLDFDFVGPSGRARVRSAWIVRQGEDFPRLTTCYVLSFRVP